MRINSQIEKAERLLNLVDTFLGASTSDVKFAILSLLLELSTNPLESELTMTNRVSLAIENFMKQNREEISCEFTEDELKEYYEGWGEFASSASSESSADSEEQPISEAKEDDMMEIENQFLNNIQQNTESQSQIWRDELLPEAPLPSELWSTDASEVSIEEFSQGRSWENPCSLSYEYSRSLLNRGLVNWPFNTVSERVLVDGVFMILLGVEAEPFILSEGKFCIQDNIQISSLTPMPLYNLLKYFSKWANEIQQISNYYEAIKKHSNFVYQEFALGIREILSSIRTEIVHYQQEFSVQSGAVTRSSTGSFPTHRITLLYLRHVLSYCRTKTRLLTSVISNAILDHNFSHTENLEMRPAYSRAYNVTYLLDYLYELLTINNEEVEMDSLQTISKIFVKSISPYIDMLVEWLCSGEVKDKAGEFMIYQSEDVKYVDTAYWWKEAFKIRTEKLEDESEIKLVPKFLYNIRDQILITGKNVNVWKHIEKHLLQRDMVESQKLKEKIFNRMKEYLGHVYAETPIEISTIIKPLAWSSTSHNALQYKEISQFNLFKFQTSSPPSTLLQHFSSSVDISPKEIHRNPQDFHCAKPWIIFNRVIKYSIEEPVLDIYTSTAQTVMKTLLEKKNLLHYFNSIRGVYLFESGEAMFPFIQFLYKKLDKGEILDNSYEINSMFKECLKALQFTPVIEQLSCVTERSPKHPEEVDALSHIDVMFYPPRPVDIFFEQAIMEKYSMLFHRILQMKRAAYSVKKIKWRNKVKGRLHPYQHRICMFQKELVHFINCFEEYILQTVVNSHTKKFIAEAEKALTIDELRDLHYKYLDKLIENSLLNPKTKGINEAASVIFNCSIKFRYLLKKFSSLEESSPSFNTDLREVIASMSLLRHMFSNSNRILVEVVCTLSQRRAKSHFTAAFNSLNFNRYYNLL